MNELEIFQTEDWKVQLKETQEWYSLYLNWENTSILIWKEKVNYIIDKWELDSLLFDISEKWTKENASKMFFQKYEELMQIDSENSIWDIEEEYIEQEEEKTFDDINVEEFINETKKANVISFDDDDENILEENIKTRIWSIEDIDKFITNVFNSWYDIWLFYFPRYDMEVLSVSKDSNWLWTINKYSEIDNIFEILEKKKFSWDKQIDNLMFYLNEWVNQIRKIVPWIKILYSYVNWTEVDDLEVNELTRRLIIEKMHIDKENDLKRQIEEKAQKTVDEMSYDELRKYQMLIEKWVNTENIAQFKKDLENEMVEVEWMIEEKERVIREYESIEDNFAILKKVKEKIEAWEINIDNVNDVLEYWSKKVNDTNLEWLDSETRKKIIDEQLEEERKILMKQQIWEEMNWTIWEDEFWLEQFKDNIDWFSKAETLLTWWKINWNRIFDKETYNEIFYALREILVTLNKEDTFLDISTWKNWEVNQVLYNIIKDYSFKNWKVRTKTKVKDSDIFLEEILFKTPDWWEFIFDVKESWLTWAKIHWVFILKWDLTANYAYIEDEIRLSDRTKDALKSAKKIRSSHEKAEKQSSRWNNSKRNYSNSFYDDNSSWFWFWWWSFFRSTPARIVWKTVWWTFKTTKNIVWWTLRWIYNFFFK